MNMNKVGTKKKALQPNQSSQPVISTARSTACYHRVDSVIESSLRSKIMH